MARRAALTACLCLVAALCRPAQAEPHHKKWIIVTTINYPTESIRILAKMSDWKASRPMTQHVHACRITCTRLSHYAHTTQAHAPEACTTPPGVNNGA